MIDQDEQKFIIGEDYFLEHYGKSGMKWGQRHAQKSLSSPSAKVGTKIGTAIRNHPKTAKTIAAGALFAGSFLAARAVSRKMALNNMVNQQRATELMSMYSKVPLRDLIEPIRR